MKKEERYEVHTFPSGREFVVFRLAVPRLEQRYKWGSSNIPRRDSLGRFVFKAASYDGEIWLWVDASVLVGALLQPSLLVRIPADEVTEDDVGRICEMSVEYLLGR